MPQVLSVEKSVGGYKLVVSGRPEDIESLVETLDKAVLKMVGKEKVPSSVPLTQQMLDVPLPQLAGSLSLSDAIAELFASDWGKRPRKITEVQEALAVNGLHSPVTSLSGKLLKLTRRLVLRRFKDDQGDYVYTQGSMVHRGSEER
jgi:hypothetical protein